MRAQFIAAPLATLCLLVACEERRPTEPERTPSAPVAPEGAPSAPASRPVAGAGVEPGQERARPEEGPKTDGEHSFVKLGKVTVPLPTGWKVKERRSPPQHFLHVTPSPEATCDIGLLDGHGRPEEAERYLSAANNAYQGEVTRADDLQVGGETFQGIHIDKPKALAEAGEATVDVYVTILGEDLVGLSFTSFGKGPGRAACEEAFGKIVKLLR